MQTYLERFLFLLGFKRMFSRKELTLQMNAEHSTLTQQLTGLETGSISSIHESFRKRFSHVPPRFSVQVYRWEELENTPAAVLNQRISPCSSAGLSYSVHALCVNVLTMGSSEVAFHNLQNGFIINRSINKYQLLSKGYQ